MQGVRRARAGPWGKGGHMSHVLRAWRERGSGPERSLIRAPGLGGTGQGGAARGPGWGGASALGRVREILSRDISHSRIALTSCNLYHARRAFHSFNAFSSRTPRISESGFRPARV